DDGANDDGVVGAVADVVDEAAVDLETVDGQGADVGEAGEAAAVVIEGDVNAQLLQLIEHGVGDIHGFDQAGLGDLHLQQGAVQLVAGQQLRAAIGQFAVVQLDGGHVEGDRDEPLTLFTPAGQLPTAGFGDPVAQLQDGAGALGQRDEVVGIDQAELGVLPTDQGLEATDLVVAQVDLGLEMQHQF